LHVACVVSRRHLNGMRHTGFNYWRRMKRNSGYKAAVFCVPLISIKQYSSLIRVAAHRGRFGRTSYLISA